MNHRTQSVINRSLALLLTVTLLPSSQLTAVAAQGREVVAVFQFFDQAQERIAWWLNERAATVSRSLFGDGTWTVRPRLEAARQRWEEPLGEAVRAETGRWPNRWQPTAPPPRPQADGMNFFNGPLQFTTMIESPTNPACGCSGEPTYNHGISLVTEEPSKCDRAERYPGIDQDTGGATVFLHNGEFFLHKSYLEILGRGFSFKFELSYRSGIIFDGPLGHNWEFNYNRRLFIEHDATTPSRIVRAIRMDGYGRADSYEADGDGFKAPVGFYTRLKKNGDGTFTERDRYGSAVFYSAEDARGIARMKEVRDHNDNRMTFEYDALGQMIRVKDVFGRAIEYRYKDKRLVEVEDFSGRKLSFEYDPNGDLVRVTSPKVDGTPNGNNFPQGKPTQYVYSSGFADERLNHNLTDVIAPAELAAQSEDRLGTQTSVITQPGTRVAVPRVHVEYDNAADSPNLDRVRLQTVGGVNISGVPAGGTIHYEYQSLGAAPAGDLNTPIFRNLVTDRNGNLTEYVFNQLGNIVGRREFTNRGLRAGDAEFFETLYEYNKDGEMTRMILPEGNAVEYVYDEANPDRLQQGNLLAETKVPDARRGGDQAFRRTTFSYEPIYNQVRTITEARGNDPSFVPPLVPGNSPQRYTTEITFGYQEGNNIAGLAAKLGLTMAEVQALLTRSGIPMRLGDKNGDQMTDQVSGNPVSLKYPVVNLPGPGKEGTVTIGRTQVISEQFQFNQFGQLTRRIHPEGDVDTYDYHPENDPGGNGHQTPNVSGDGHFGYLKEFVRDDAPDAMMHSAASPDPAKIKSKFVFDQVGNLTRYVDGRGVATEYSFNNLNQVVEIRRAANVDDALNNMEEPDWKQCGSPLVECQAGMKAFNYRTQIFYDFNGNVFKVEVENRDSNNQSLAGSFVESTFTYDILDKLVERTHEVSEDPPEVLITRHRYDRNGNLVLELSPAANLPPGHPGRQPSNVKSYVFDERDLRLTSTRGGLTAQFRCLPANGDIREAVAVPDSRDISTFRYDYDANRNMIQVTDGADNNGDGQPEVTLMLFDGFDLQVSVIDAAGNQTLTEYDPASNAVRVSKFGPVGGTTPPNNAAANVRQPLKLGDISQPLLSQVEYQYDEIHRQFEKDERLFDYRDQGVKYVRTPQLTDGPEGVPDDGVVVTRYEYDRDSRLTTLVEDNGNTFKTTYDGAGRAVLKTDPEGNRVRNKYDDNNNLTQMIELEVTQPGDVAAGKVPDLCESFVTINVYDALNRLSLTTDNIGQTTRFQYDSRDNLIRTSDARSSENPDDLITDPLHQFPVTGIDCSALLATSSVAKPRKKVTAARAAAAQPADKINRTGNTMEYLYDGLKRKIAEVHALRVGGVGKSPIDIGNPANPDGLVVIDYGWDANSRLIAMADDGSSPEDQNTSPGVIESGAASGNVTRYAYDDLDRRAQEIFDDGTIKDYAYDADDNLIQMIDQNGSIISNTYDSVNRLARRDIRRASSGAARKGGGFQDPGVTWKVVGTTLQRFEYDGLYRPTLSFDNNDPDDPLDDQPVTTAYDSLSRVLEEKQCEFAVSSRWASNHNRVGLVYPDDRELEITFDKLDRINTIRDKDTDNAIKDRDGKPLDIVDYDYIGPERVLERTYANGVRLTYLNDARRNDVGYDGARRMVAQRHRRKDNSSVVDFTYGYDRANNKLFESREQDGKARRDDYGYDSLNRLVIFEHGGEKTADNWQLDGVGNWARRKGVANQVNNLSEYTEAAGVRQLHDDNGNLIDDGTLIYRFDFANRLRRVERKSDHALIAIYSYDALNRRFQSSVTNSRGAGDNLNGTVRYFYDGWREIEERRGGTTQQYVYGRWIDEPLTLDISNGIAPKIAATYFYHEDGKHHISALTDATGAVAERYSYDAYGKATITGSAGGTLSQSSVGNPYLFCGRRLDLETGLYYFRERYLDPLLGRFIQRDPVGMWMDRMNLGNGYAYVGNNPLNKYDPTGEGWTDYVNPVKIAKAGWKGVKTAGSLIAAGVTYSITALDFAYTWTNPLTWVALGLDQFDNPVASALSFAIKFTRSPITTTVGLGIGLYGLATGRVKDVSFKKGLVAFEWDPGGRFSGTTFGGVVQLWHGKTSDKDFEHEVYHSYQYLSYGDLFIPSYVVWGGVGLLSSALAGKPQWTCAVGVSNDRSFGQPLETGGELISDSSNCM